MSKLPTSYFQKIGKQKKYRNQLEAMFGGIVIVIFSVPL
jgi:hypothetical protein